jgi:hypothetical protein
MKGEGATSEILAKVKIISLDVSLSSCAPFLAVEHVMGIYSEDKSCGNNWFTLWL